MIIAPLFMFEYKGEIDLDMDDFEEFMGHPLTEQMMLTLPQVIEALTRTDLDSLKTQRVNMEKFKESEPNSSSLEEAENGEAFMDLVTELTSNMESEINLKLGSEGQFVSKSTFKSAGLGNLLDLICKGVYRKWIRGSIRDFLE